MEKELKILFLEDNPSDAELIQREITKNGIKFEGMLVETKEGYNDAMITFKPDIILSDYSLPQYTGMQALALRNEIAPDIPFILVTGSNNEEVAVNCMKAGADDYILKQSIMRLGPAIKSAIEKKKILEDKKQAEKLLKSIIDKNPLSIQIVDEEGYTIQTNDAHTKLFGAVPPPDYSIFRDRQIMTQGFVELFECVKRGEEVKFPDFYFNVHDVSPEFPDRPIWLRLVIFPLLDNTGKQIQYVMMHEDITERRNAEEAIKESEAMLKFAQKSAGAGLWDWNMKTNQLKWSPELFDLFGLNAEHDKASFENWDKCMHPDDKEAAYNKMNLSIEDHTQLINEYRTIHTDGKIRWINAIGNTTYDRDENPIRNAGICIDITERKRIVDELKKSEERFKYAALATEDVIYDWDLLKNEGWFSEIYYKQFGYKEKVWRSVEWRENIHPDDYKRTISITDSVINNGGTTWTCEYRFKRADGSYAYIIDCGYVLRDSEGNPIRLIGSLIDFTKRKNAELEIRKLSSAVEQSPASIVITDLKGDIEYVNPKFTEVTGYTFEEARGKNTNILKTDETPSEEYKKLWEKITSGEEWRGEFHNKKKNGEYYWESASISPIRNNEGIITKFLAVKEDITEKKLKETELIEAREKAEEMNRLKSNFLANMSHELRTPMVAILGFSEILSSKLINEEDKKLAEIILKGGKRLTQTLNLILDLSRVESSKMEVESKRENISVLVKSTVKLFELDASKKNLKIITHITDDVFSDIDVTMFEKVVENLIHNAIKYTDNGEIEIITGYERIKNDKYAYVRIKDTGIGIQENMKQQIFEPFRQASEGRSRHFEGTGLGLSISKKYVELMKGNIFVESEFGKGSEFKLRFKASELLKRDNKNELNENEEVVRKPKNEKLKDSRVLIVEDDEFCVNLQVNVIKGICKYDIVNSGEEALELVKNKKYSAIFMDIGLKGISGLETAKEIKKIKEYSEIPIVAVTAYAMVGDRENILKNGCTHYISKPYSIKEFRNLVLNILQ